MRLISIVDGIPVLCGSKSQLTFNHFVDPHHPEKTEVSILCQIHRDEIVRPMTRPYELKGNDIKVEQSKIKKDTKRLSAMEINYVPDARERMEKLYQERHTITFDSCRDLLCNDEGNRHKPLNPSSIYTLLSFGQNGRLAHWFYFHEDCWKRMKRVFGLGDFTKRPQNHMLTSFN